MKTLEQITKIFYYKDLRKKILITLGLVIIFRFMAHIPTPGVDLEALKTFFSRSQLFGLFDIFSGGAMSRFSIVMMGVAPYITASIIMQLLVMVIPSLEALSREGERGRQVINQYTRYLTVPLAALEAFGMITFLSKQPDLSILPELTVSKMAIIILTITAGTMFLMWLGELITENGIGNGISLIIFIGIIARGPEILSSGYVWLVGGGNIAQKLITLGAFLLLSVLVILAIVMVEKGTRQIPIVYAKRVRGMRMYGGTSTYLPLKVNQGGVIPIIFAMSFMIFPGVIANFLTKSQSPIVSKIAHFLSSAFSPTSFFYGLTYFLLVVAFTYFYTSVTFKPPEVAENLQKQGGFIPGIRPGRPTSEYLNYLIYRITFAGALFLGIIAILPFIVQRAYPGLSLTLGGTAVLIVVAVLLELVERMKSQLLMRSYDNY